MKAATEMELVTGKGLYSPSEAAKKMKNDAHCWERFLLNSPIHSKSVPASVPTAKLHANKIQLPVTRLMMRPTTSPRVAPPHTAFGPFQCRAREIKLILRSETTIILVLSLYHHQIVVPLEDVLGHLEATRGYSSFSHPNTSRAISTCSQAASFMPTTPGLFLLFCAYFYFSFRNLVFNITLKRISAKLVPFIQEALN